MKIVILTGSELRHDFFRKYLACQNDIDALQSFCESQDGNLQQVISSDNLVACELRNFHLMNRTKTEQDFFQLFCDTIIDKSKPVYIKKGTINEKANVDAIISMRPDLIISYGCSIIKSSIIHLFDKKIINIHLGLSPYYKGAGTNFWPFVNNELTFVGATFMFMDKGVDTGDIIHQIRADIRLDDNVHQIGNRLIRDMAKELVEVIYNFNKLDKASVFPFDKGCGKIYRMKDYTERSVQILNENIRKGIVTDYLQNKVRTDSMFPIIKSKVIKSSHL